MYHEFKQCYRFEIHKNTHTKKKMSSQTENMEQQQHGNSEVEKKDGRTSTSRAYEKDMVTIIRGDTC